MSTEKINLLLKTLQQAEFLTTKSAIANNLIKRQNHIMSVSAGVLLNNKKVSHHFLTCSNKNIFQSFIAFCYKHYKNLF